MFPSHLCVGSSDILIHNTQGNLKINVSMSTFLYKIIIVLKIIQKEDFGATTTPPCCYLGERVTLLVTTEDLTQEQTYVYFIKLKH